MKVAWAFQLGAVDMGFQATPLVADGVVYIIGPKNRVFALDGAAGDDAGTTSTRFGKDNISFMEVRTGVWP